MILMSEYHLGTVPFRTIYLHGTVRDDKGIKMSKSLGNGIDPLDVAKEFGADAGRMALVIGTGAGTDSKISKDKIKGYKNFANKIWNIARFVLSNTEGFEYDPNAGFIDTDIEDMRKEFAEASRELDELRIHNAAERIYHYIWHTFADRILEASKSSIDDPKTKWKLYHILEQSLRMLHPFMPFVTEEIWQELPHKKERPFLMVERAAVVE